MKKNLQIIVIFMIIWVILNENVELLTLLMGIPISIVTLKVTNNLLKMDYAKTFYVSPVDLGIYFLKLIRDIYVTGYDMLKRTIKGDITPTFIEYESTLSDPLLLMMLSNAITLPPGEVTVSRDKNQLMILSPNNNVEEVRLQIYEGIEKGLERLEKKQCS